jgi:transposase
MTAKLFEAALGISPPWAVASVDFDESAKTSTVLIDFKAGSRFEVSGHEDAHPVRETATKTHRHLNFFQHECAPASARAAGEATRIRKGGSGRSRPSSG